MLENENSESSSEETEGTTQGSEPKEPTPKTFTQEEVNRLIAKEKTKYKGFSELKTKAEKYDELANASKTDLEKANERASAAEAKLAKFEAKEHISAWKASAAKATGVPLDLLRGSTEEEINEHADSLKEHFTTDAAPTVSSDGFAPEPGSEKSTKDLFASTLDGII